MSRVCRPMGEWTILLSVFKAVVIENCFTLFRLDSEKVGDSVPFVLGKDFRKGEPYFSWEDW